MIEQILNFLAYDVWNLLTCSACTSGNCQQHSDAYYAQRYPGKGKIIDGAEHFRRLMADVCPKSETECHKTESDDQFNEAEMDKFLEEYEKNRLKGDCGEHDDNVDDEEDANKDECETQSEKSRDCKNIDKALVETVVIKCSQSSIDELFTLEARAEELYREYTAQESASKCAAPAPWHKLKSWHKVSYYWAAMTGEIPKTDPFKNFQRFYSAEDECGLSRPANEARLVWAEMDMESRMPFVLEAFIGRMAMDQVNVDDEHDIERCFTALLARAERAERCPSKCEPREQQNTKKRQCSKPKSKSCGRTKSCGGRF